MMKAPARRLENYMPLFTFILDYAGGTYISQVRASGTTKAVNRWLTSLEPKVIQGLTPKKKESLADQLAGDEPVAVEGSTNVWCVSAVLRGSLALINIVKTSEL
jgi:hypothetical protein